MSNYDKFVKAIRKVVFRASANFCSCRNGFNDASIYMPVFKIHFPIYRNV